MIVTEQAKNVICSVAQVILSIKRSHPVRVAIDGMDGAGKTHFADELASVLRSSSRQIVRASIDGFHNQREVRYKRGRYSAEGYYRDSFNLHAIIANLLKPLGPEGDGIFSKAIFDYKEDAEIAPVYDHVETDAILLMDGVFLQRPELVNYWDYRIFLDVDAQTVMRRVLERDSAYIGSEQEIRKLYESRYVPGQKMYFEESLPKGSADMIIDNSDFRDPKITRKKLGH